MNLDFLTSREQAEVKLSQVYVEHFDHGTSGHMAYSVIAKLAKHIQELAGEIERLKAENKQEYMD